MFKIPGFREDHSEHIIYALGIQFSVWIIFLLLGLSNGLLVGGILVCGIFYGREERDHEIKACTERKCNLATLTWLDLVPMLKWSRDGRWDFACPVGAVISIVFIWIILILFL